MDAPSEADDKPLTPVQNAGGCALFLGIALGIGVAAWRGSAAGLSPDQYRLSGLASAISAVGLVAMLWGTDLRPKPGPLPSWRDAADHAMSVTGGTALAAALMLALGRAEAKDWAIAAAIMPLQFIMVVTIRRCRLLLWRRNVDPRGQEPLQ